MRLEPATGADANQAAGSQHDELFEDDASARGAHTGGLHADGPTAVGAGVTEHSPLLVHQTGPRIENVFGDVGGPSGVAGAQDCRGVIAALGS